MLSNYVAEILSDAEDYQPRSFYADSGDVHQPGSMNIRDHGLESNRFDRKSKCYDGSKKLLKNNYSSVVSWRQIFAASCI